MAQGKPKFYLFEVSFAGKKRQAAVMAHSYEAALYGIGAIPDEEVKRAKLTGADAKLREWTTPMKISADDRAGFYETLANFVASGAPLHQAIMASANSVNSPILRGVIGQICLDISKNGMSPGEAFAEHPEQLGDVAVATVRAADVSGRHGEVFRDLAEAEGRAAILRKKIVSALIYPGVILAMAIGALIVTIFFVLPNVKLNYDAVGAEVPPLFAPFVNFSIFMVDNPWLMGIPVAALILMIYFLPKIMRTTLVQKGLVRMPVVGPFMREAILVRCLNTLVLMIRCGVPIVDAYKYAQDVAGNLEFTKYFKQIRERVIRGDEPYQAFMAERNSVPGGEGTLLAQKVYTASYGGNTDEVLAKTSKNMTSQLLVKAEDLPKNIAPLMMLMLAPIVLAMIFFTVFPQLWLVIEALRNN